MLTKMVVPEAFPLIGTPDGRAPREPEELFTTDPSLVDRATLAAFLGISEKTLDRRFTQGKWDQAEAYRLGLLFSLRQQATEVFGDAARASIWLQTPLPTLDNQAPLALLDSISGFERARNTLLRQAYGMY